MSIPNTLKSILTIIVLVVSIAAWAVPPQKRWLRLPVEGGDSAVVMLRGSDYSHWYESADGQRYQLVSGILHTWSGISTELSETTPQCYSSDGTVLARQHRSAARAMVGRRRGLIVLLEFPDLRFSPAGTREEYDAMYNEVGYSHFDHIGSVHDYFLDQSYGQFDVSFDVVGPVMLSKPFGYYGQNNSQGGDMHVAEMAAEACVAIDDTVDFSTYDWFGKGEVDQVFFIFAGPGENYGGVSSDHLYPMQFSLDMGKSYHDGNGRIELDGTAINVFATTCELANGREGKLNGIGTACHEFSHCFGLPDVYNVNQTSSIAMNAWDLMDYGNYNGPDRCGEAPAPYTAYERWLAGWLEPTELSHPCYVSGMQCLQDTAEAYVIYNDANYNEYFMLENRQHRRWDSCTGGDGAHGILVSHIFYDKNAWEHNAVNTDPKMQRITYIPADGLFGVESGDFRPKPSDYDGDLFPGILHRNELTDTSTPAFQCYTADSAGVRLMHKPLTDISEDGDGNISFTFMGGVNFAAPVPLPATDIAEGGFTANWMPVDAVTDYELQLWRIAPDSIAQPFREWEGRALSDYNGYLQVGTSSAQSGELISPCFHAEGDVTITFDAKLYRASDTKALSIILTTEGGRQIASETCVLASAESTYSYTFTGVNDNVRITIIPAKRALFSSVHVGYAVTAEYQTVAIAADDATAAEGWRASMPIDALAPSSRYVYRLRAIGPLGTTPWGTTMEVQTLSADSMPVPEIAGLGN